MALIDNDPQKSQLGGNGSGIRNFNTPDDIAKGGGSRLISNDAGFGTMAQNDRASQATSDLNRQMHMNRKKERAVRVGYRKMVKRGDGAGALRLLQDAEKGGVNPFGIRQSGERATTAAAQISSKRGVEVHNGARKFEPEKDYFQKDLVQDGPGLEKFQGNPESGSAPQGEKAEAPTLSSLFDEVPEMKDGTKISGGDDLESLEVEQDSKPLEKLSGIGVTAETPMTEMLKTVGSSAMESTADFDSLIANADTMVDFSNPTNPNNLGPQALFDEQSEQIRTLQDLKRSMSAIDAGRENRAKGKLSWESTLQRHQTNRSLQGLK